MFLPRSCLSPLPRSIPLLGLALLLMAVLSVRADQPNKGPHSPPPAARPADEQLPPSSSSLEDLKDEAEVLEVQVKQAGAELKSKQAYLDFRDKQYRRISELRKRGAIAESTQDEERDRRDAAEHARDAARGRLAVLQTKLKMVESRLARQGGHPDQSVQMLRDAIVLLEAQRKIRQAELHAAETALEAVDRHYQRGKGLAERRAIEERLVEEQEARRDASQAEVEVRKAALLEPTVRLEQARRRLKQLEQNGKASEAAVRAPQTDDRSLADRVQKLEKDLNALADELKALRRDMESRKSPPTEARK